MDLFSTISIANNIRIPMIEKMSGMKDGINHFFYVGILPYLDSFRDKYYYSKTFLHRLEKQEFYDLFFPIYLKGKKGTIKTDSINEVFSQSNFVTIVGEAGSSKSMLTKHLFLNAIKESFKIPILIELRKVVENDNSLFEYIVDFLFNNKFILFI